MKKLFTILFSLLTVSLWSQVPFYKDVVIQKTAPMFWGNGSGASLKLNSTRIYESSGNLILSGGLFKIGTDTVEIKSFIRALLNLKAPKDSPVFTTTATFPGSITIGGTILTGQKAGYLTDVNGNIGAGLSLKANAYNTRLTGIAVTDALNVGGKFTIDSILGQGGYSYMIKKGNDTLPPYIPFNMRAKASDWLPIGHHAAADTSSYPIPDKICDFYFDTLNGKVYGAISATRGGWVKLN